MAILHNQPYKVYAEGELVTIELGNVPITVDYHTALQMAQFLRIAGRKAKSNAGDNSFTVKAFGLLSDAEADEKAAQKRRSFTGFAG